MISLVPLSVSVTGNMSLVLKDPTWTKMRKCWPVPWGRTLPTVQCPGTPTLVTWRHCFSLNPFIRVRVCKFFILMLYIYTNYLVNNIRIYIYMHTPVAKGAKLDWKAERSVSLPSCCMWSGVYEVTMVTVRLLASHQMNWILSYFVSLFLLAAI